MDVDDIATTEAENMSKVFNNPTRPIIYSLSQELIDNIAELAGQEKKIALGNGLLAKVNDPILISKLKKEKEGFEEQKNNLIIRSKKLEYIINSIKDFTLFFIFIRRFYTLAIIKGNFEDSSKNISLKLVNNLKTEEEDLYHAFVDGDCFSKVLVGLSFESYQCYFKEYSKTFFDEIQSSSDFYIDSLSILRAVFCEFTYFNTDNFNLTELKFFLSKNIPANVPLPSSNYELVALRCFFFYEMLIEYLKLRPVKTNLDCLKKSVKLELNVINYKANTRETLIGLYDLQEALSKIEKKLNDFLGRKSEEDKEADVNNALIFYKVIEIEIHHINKKTETLFNNKYLNLTKMRRLLVITVNEAYLPKFLELFNLIFGNDFLLNKLKKLDHIESNKEAINHLFLALCRDESCTPLNERINSFINELTEAYPKDDITVLDNITLEDLIEFSFYYILTLFYIEFNASLKGFNNKLLYTEMVTFNIFINIKVAALKILEKKITQEISKFFEKAFKNKTEYELHKKNIREEIKLYSEVIRDAKRILSDTRAIESTLTPKLESSLVPMPDENLLGDLLKALEAKLTEYQLEYQKLEEHKFINKPKSVKLNKASETSSKKNTEIECNKAIEYFYESLSCLSENLSECLKHIKENTQDINQFSQKISSATDQIFSSIQKLLSILSSWKNPNETPDLASLSLPKLLALVQEFVIKNTLIVRKNHKKKLTQLQELLNNSSSSIELLIGQVNSIINKYYNYNNEAKKILNMLSTSFMENNSNSQFFSKSLTKKVKRQMNGKLFNDYILLKEQSNWLEKIIRLIKCDTDDRAIKLYALIVEADDYQKAYRLLNEKINSLKKIPNKKQGFSTFITEKNPCDGNKKVGLLHSDQLIEVAKYVTVENLSDAHVEKILPIFTSMANGNEQFNLNEGSMSIQEHLDVEKKSEEESLSIQVAQGKLSNNSNLANKNLLEDYESWNIEFEKWKNEKHTKLYELFHIIESCSKSVLNSSAKAFLKYLSLYQKEFSDKNDELRKNKNQIILYFKSSNKSKIIVSYLAQFQKWFDGMFDRIILCRTLILQNENDPIVQESPRLLSPFADNRAEFNNLLTFYLGVTDKYNKFRDDLICEENKLNTLNRNFIKQILMLGPLDGIDNEDSTLTDFSKQLDRVNQLKLVIEQEFETKQKIKEKLFLLASPEIVKFYLSRIDPCDADSLKNTENYLLPTIQIAATTDCVVPMLAQECNICTPTAFYYLPPSMPVAYPVDGVQPQNQIFYSM